MKNFIRAIKELRLLHGLSAVTAGVFCLLALLSSGEMDGLYGWLLLVGGGLLLAAGWWHNTSLVRWLQPVQELCREMDAGRTPSPSLTEAARSALAAYRDRDTRRTLWSWVLGGILLLVVLGIGVGVTLWQGLLLAVVLSEGAVISAGLGLLRGTAGLGELRRLFEEKLPGKIAVPGVSLTEMFGWVAAAVVLGFFMVALHMGSLSSRREAAQILEQASPQLQQCSLAYLRVKSENPTWPTEKVFETACRTKTEAEKVLLLDLEGRLQTVADIDTRWLARLVRSGASSWLDRRAPFLYRLQPVLKDGFLLWHSPWPAWPEGTAAQSWLLTLVICAACLLMVGMSAAVIRRHLSVFGLRLGRLAQGNWQALEEESPRGLLAPLAAGGQAMVRGLRQLLEQHKDDVNRLAVEQERLAQLAGGLHALFEGRTDMAEQTATSIIQMRSAIQSVTEQLDSLREASADNSSSMLELDHSVREVARAAENLGSQVEDSASAIAEIAVSMEQVVSSVENLEKTALDTQASLVVIEKSIQLFDDHTRQTYRLSENVSEMASRGAASVDESISGIHQIQQITSEAQQIINRLGGRMEAIGKILTVIGDVAEQTNLLALNAAIIAAAAGEHGKGFAVVADEIKELADRTSTSTKEIAGLIRNIQSDSRLAIETIDRGSESVRQGVELADRARAALREILDSVQQVNQMAQNVTRSLADHASVTSRMASSIAGISNMVRQIKRAVSEQSQGGGRIRKISEQMRDEAQFVQRSSGEQVRAVEGVVRNTERIAEMVAAVGKAMVEQSNGVNHVTKVVVKVRDEAESDRIKLADTRQLALSLLEVTQVCQRRMTELLGEGKNGHER